MYKFSASIHKVFRVRDLMADEIRQLKSARDLNGFFPDTPDTSGDDYVNIMRMLEEELMSELKEQEAVLIQQYEDMKRLEEEELQETVARYFDPDTDGENGALVPCRCHSSLPITLFNIYQFKLN